MTDDIQRAQRAKAILEDPLMVEAREYIEAECWRLFKKVSPEDTEALTQIKAMQYMHEKYAAFLNSVIQNGKIAQLNIERTQPRPKGY